MHSHPSVLGYHVASRRDTLPVFPGDWTEGEARDLAGPDADDEDEAFGEVIDMETGGPCLSHPAITSLTLLIANHVCASVS